jgi:hypothetical protein
MTEVKGNKDVKARCGCVVVVVAGECSAWSIKFQGRTISVESTLALNSSGCSAKVAYVHGPPPDLPQHQAIQDSLSLLPNCKKFKCTLTYISHLMEQLTATSTPLYWRYSFTSICTPSIKNECSNMAAMSCSQTYTSTYTAK